MWRLAAEIDSWPKVWFSDKQPHEAVRGGPGTSCRMIVENQGFLDITEVESPPSTESHPPKRKQFCKLDFNGVIAQVSDADASGVFSITLKLDSNGTFVATADHRGGPVTVSGTLKKLPEVNNDDIAKMEKLFSELPTTVQAGDAEIGETKAGESKAGEAKAGRSESGDSGYGESDTGGSQATKQPSHDDIAKLGLQFFPFLSMRNYTQLAKVVYDWMTSSFPRTILLNMLEYTGIEQNPHPLDLASIADIAWKLGLTKPLLIYDAKSPDEVAEKLNALHGFLQDITAVQNRLLGAAFLSMPRTNVVGTGTLYSGVLIPGLATDRFGSQFLECPLNSGPIGTPLRVPITRVLDTYVQKGKTITTKMMWGFTDSSDEALIDAVKSGVLVSIDCADDGSWAWEMASCVAPFAEDETKRKFVFAPGTAFEVLGTNTTHLVGHEITEVRLRPVAQQQVSVSAPATSSTTEGSEETSTTKGSEETAASAEGTKTV